MQNTLEPWFLQNGILWKIIERDLVRAMEKPCPLAALAGQDPYFPSPASRGDNPSTGWLCRAKALFHHPKSISSCQEGEAMHFTGEKYTYAETGQSEWKGTVYFFKLR